MWLWHPWNTSGEPALAKGREQITENTPNTPLLPAAAARVPAGKRFSPPTSVSIVLEISFGLGRSEFLSSRGLSHPSPVKSLHKDNLFPQHGDKHIPAFEKLHLSGLSRSPFSSVAEGKIAGLLK